jgi:putative flippase GtrA
MRLTSKDLLFAGLNGALIGTFSPYIFKNFGGILPVSHLVFALFFTVLCMVGVATGYLLAKTIRPFFFQLAKFGIIGVSNTIIDLGIYALLIYLTGTTTGILITLFKTFSVTIAIINSYIWNKYWAFKHEEAGAVGKEFAQFVTVSLFGLVMNVSITSLLVNLIGAPGGFSGGAWATTSGAFASVCVLAWNFLGYKLIVFKK